MAAKESEVAQAPAKESKGGIVQTVIFAVGLFVLMVLSQFLFEMMACKVAAGLLPNCGEIVASETEEDVEEELGPPIYLPLDPPLVATFEDKSAVRFLQLTLEVMSRDQAAIDAVQTHMPVIRNSLLLLMGGRTVTDLTSREGKEALRAEALEEMQRILVANTGEPGVEELYFTSFVVQ
ncbi:MAG: flagellar basal body-associated FliL family protein [Gammaproteobacteria bacterium]|nr:flagellar basal body-associated FliL family protein [Gammaproteobacteria bacterium]